MAIRPLLPLSFVLLGACSGPRLHLQNPEGHPTFVDGVRTDAGALPFRYYGTTRWDALPKDIDVGRGLRPDWQRRPTQQEVAVPWPASPLLFPLDLPLEFTRWLFGGQQDVTATVAVPLIAGAERSDGESTDSESTDRESTDRESTNRERLARNSPTAAAIPNTGPGSAGPGAAAGLRQRAAAARAAR